MSRPRSAARFKAFAPLLLGVLIVVLTRVPSVARRLEHMQFGVAAWGYARIRINIVTSAGFFILVTALVCYLFRVKNANAAKDFWSPASEAGGASRRCCRQRGGVPDGGYRADRAARVKCFRAAERWFTRRSIRPWRFWAGWLSDKGLPADFLFSRMQVAHRAGARASR